MPWVKNDYGDFEYEFTRSRMQEAGGEILSWLESEQREYVDFILNIVASLPGGDLLADAGYGGMDFLGWKEMDLLSKMLEAIQDTRDTEEMAEALAGPPEEDEFEGEE